jgi:hypothetical protein
MVRWEYVIIMVDVGQSVEWEWQTVVLGVNSFQYHLSITNPIPPHHSSNQDGRSGKPATTLPNYGTITLFC